MAALASRLASTRSRDAATGSSDERSSRSPLLIAACNLLACPRSAAVSRLGEPVALWREGVGAPPLGEWLARSGSDPRLRLTILAAPDQAARALSLAASSQRPARIVLDAGRSGVEAALTYDQGEALAQALQKGPAKETLP